MRLRFDSLLSRILGLHVLALILAAIAVPVITSMVLNATASSMEDQTLLAHAQAIQRHLHSDRQGSVRLSLPPDLASLYSRGLDGYSYSVVDAAGRLIGSSEKGAIFGHRQSSASQVYFQHSHGNAMSYGASVPAQIGNRSVWIEVAQDGANPDVIVDDIVLRFLNRIGWFTIPILLLVLAADVFAVRRALRPLNEASGQASRIDASRLDLRLDVAKLPKEIRPLVGAFNQVLDRLERSFRVQREFTADAAHELRTPLSILRARVDAIRDGVLAEPLKRDIEVMARIIDQLLQVAELDLAVELGEVIDLRTICINVADFVAPMAQSVGTRIVSSGVSTPVLVTGNAEMLFHAIRNLAENAVKYSPRGSTVEIHLDDSGVVSVLDEGPGVPATDQELIFRRFWRRNRSQTTGAGLGLAIASRIVSAHGGRLEVANRRPHGAAFSIHMALATV